MSWTTTGGIWLGGGGLGKGRGIPRRHSIPGGNGLKGPKKQEKEGVVSIGRIVNTSECRVQFIGFMLPIVTRGAA